MSLLAADAELVGLLALATDPAAEESLGLSDDQLENLLDLLDAREAAALAIASQVRELNPEQRADKLRPLRVESQRRMAGVLSDAQLDKLANLAKVKPNEFYEPIAGDMAAPTLHADENAQPQVVENAESQSQAASEPVDNDSVTGSESDYSSEVEQDAAADATPAKDGSSQVDPKADVSKPSGRMTSGIADSETPTDSTTPAEPIEPAEPIKAVDTTKPSKPIEQPSSDGKLSFSFRYQPWQDVLDWFAEQSDLSLVLEAPPSGTFNYTDNRRYTPTEALDVLNSVLLTKGYTLVRRERMLVLVNLEDGVPPNLVTDVPLEDLDERGEYELIRVLFQVRNMTPEAASEEVSRLVGPQGAVVVLPRAGMLQVTETAGRIRAIQKVIQAIERPDASKLGGINPYQLEYASASAVLPVLRQMLGIPADAYSTPEGTLQLALDTSTSSRLLAYGTPEMMKRLEEVLQLVDVPDAASGPIDSLQLEVYPTGEADPEAALLVLQTLLSEEPGTRLATDPQTGNLVALTTMANHATIRATLSQMQEDARAIEVIPLTNVDPQLALLSITKLFGIAVGEEADPRAPIVDADLSTNSLLVRGSRAQIDQIKALLGKMGESADSIYASGDRGNVRLLPLTAAEARTALEQVNQIWPTIRSNPIKMVSPAAAIRSYRPAEQRTPDEPTAEQEAAGLEGDIEHMLRIQLPAEPDLPSDRETMMISPRPKAKLVVYQDTSGERDATTEIDKPSTGAPILVSPGPSGLLVASDDLDALDAFERILEASTMQSGNTGREYAVFYLKHAKAATAAAILSDIFGTSSSSGGDLMSGIADAALGDIGGGLMGDLLGLGGSGPSTGFSAAGVDIVTDARLNALIVYARPDDIDMVFRLLQIVDQRTGPTDVEAEGVARLISVNNTSASQVAEVVKQIYANRIEGGSSGQPSPEDLMRMLRNAGGNKGADTQELAKMTIGVDSRSNSLVVRAPDMLFYEVKALVEQLDTEQLDSTQSTQIISLKYSNSQAIKEALGPILGEQSVTTAKASDVQNTASGANQNGGNNARQQQEMIRRMQEFRSRMQQSGGRGSGGGGRGGRGTGGGGRGGR